MTKKPAVEISEVVTTRTYVAELPVKLSTEEVAERAQQLADCHQQLAEHEDKAESVKKGLGKEKQIIVTRRAMLSGVVKRKEEPREVRVLVQQHFGSKKYLEVREDTGEIIAERPLRPEEMQRKLGLVVQLPPDDELKQ